MLTLSDIYFVTIVLLLTLCKRLIEHFFYRRYPRDYSMIILLLRINFRLEFHRLQLTVTEKIDWKFLKRIYFS